MFADSAPWSSQQNYHVVLLILLRLRQIASHFSLIAANSLDVSVNLSYPPRCRCSDRWLIFVTSL